MTTVSPASASDPAPDWPRHSTPLRAASDHKDIRDRLREWEAANPAPALLVPLDEPVAGSVANTLARNSSQPDFAEPDVANHDHDATQAHFDGRDMADLDLNGSALGAGDLVEVNSGWGSFRVLAVCLGSFNGHLHFYTNRGKWFTSRSIRSGFIVRGFVDDPAELDAIVEAIPSLSSSAAVLGELQDQNLGPSRDLAAFLLRRLYKFQAASHRIHQAHVETLSRADILFGTEEKILSLREIADVLLPASLKQGKSVFPPEALFTVYTVVTEADIAFRALDRLPRRQESYLFALQSAQARRNIAHVEECLREYSEHVVSQSKPIECKTRTVPARFDAFLQRARQLIDQTRTTREWSPHGTIGPYTASRDALLPSEEAGQSSAAEPLQVPNWDAHDLPFIEFMQHWAASRGFSSGSRYHWVGASILRALGRYEDAILDGTTGWTFLQEIGWIPPWDINARHALRLPKTQLDRHAAPLSHPRPADGPLNLGIDRLSHLRQDFASSTVYCIDSADTLDVDDGISLEPAGNGEWWIHIHIADPASHIKPYHPLGKQAAQRVQTSYLAGFSQRMLEHDAVRAAFSLGPDKPALTFSARVTETGRVLDTKITPGTLRTVVYITPEDVSAVVGDTDPSTIPGDVLEVGTPRQKDPFNIRTMTTPDQLSEAQVSELHTLSKLATALQRVRLDNGAVPVYPPRPKAKVSEGRSDGPPTTGEGWAFYKTDPYIRVAYDGQGSPLVSSLMQLAGEIGARWCHERSIPIPYRIQRLTPEGKEALLAFNRDVFYPKLLAGKELPVEDWNTLRTLVGTFDVSTSPAPQLAMGVDMYARVTSPLRRYADLVVHWQIIAALLQEDYRGKSLAGSKNPLPGPGEAAREPRSPENGDGERPESLPFTRRKLEDEVLPRLRIVERTAKLLDNVDGNNQWILQALVRAWRFGEAPLPATFRLTVSQVAPDRRNVLGKINWFDRPARVDVGDLNGVARIADVKAGDVFEVELTNVNVHTNMINVKVLGKIEGEENLEG